MKNKKGGVLRLSTSPGRRISPIPVDRPTTNFEIKEGELMAKKYNVYSYNRLIRRYS